ERAGRDDGWQLLGHSRGLRKLPGGQPPKPDVFWNSADSERRSGPFGPHRTSRSFSRARPAARFHGPSSVIGPSTQKRLVSWSATIRKNGSGGFALNSVSMLPSLPQVFPMIKDAIMDK